MLKNILMLTSEEPNPKSRYTYYYEKSVGIPAVAGTYGNVRIWQEELFSLQDTLVIASKVEQAVEYRTKGFAVLLQLPTEELENTHTTTQEQFRYVIDYPCDCTDEFLYKVFCRENMLPLIVGETRRMWIREITLSDVTELYPLYEDEDARRFMEPLYDYEAEIEYQREYIQNMYALYDYGMWVLIHKETGQLIGRAGISHRVIDGVEQKELGYIIHPKERGKGYAREACEEILRIMRRLGVEVIHIVTERENENSIRLAKGLGFLEQAEAFLDGREYFVYYKSL